MSNASNGPPPGSSSLLDRIERLGIVRVLALLAVAITVVTGLVALWALVVDDQELASDNGDGAEVTTSSTTDDDDESVAPTVESPVTSSSSTSVPTSEAVAEESEAENVVDSIVGESQTSEELAEICALLAPTQPFPSTGEVEPVQYGCPGISGRIEVADAEHTWSFPVEAGQALSYAFGTSRNVFDARVLDPDGAVVAQLDRFERGRFVAEATGVVTFLIRGEQGQTYDFQLVDSTLPYEDPQAFSAAQYDCLSEPLLPTGAPLGAVVDIADSGCPLYKGVIDIGLATHQWRVPLEEGRTISYDFSISQNDINAEIVGPDGAVVVQLSRFDEGSFTVGVTGDHLLRVTNGTRADASYSISFVEI